MQALEDPKWASHILPAIKREIDKIFNIYKTIRVVPRKEYEECVMNHPERTVLLDCLMPITAKFNVEGKFTKVKPRIVVADKRATCQMANVYAPSVQMDTVRRQVNLEVQMRAHSVTADASDAYHQGTPPDPMSEHGRHIFVRPLRDLNECGLEHMQRGMLWRVTGNVPGIQNAGVVWGDHFGGWLLSQGYVQSVVDRRLYYRRSDDHTLSIVCVYVDDNRMISTSSEERVAYLQAFDRAFPNSVAPGALEASVACDLSGVMYEKIGKGAEARIEASCPRLHAKLRTVIEKLRGDYVLAPGTCIESPMAKDALVVLQLSSTTDTLLPAEKIELAQQIAGLGGFIVLCCRPDAYFAYVVLSQYLAHGLTKTIWNALIRWATYIYVNTALKLTYWASSEGKPWVVYVDSSLFNAPNSRSMGGYLAMYEGSGAFAWRCFSPPPPAARKPSWRRTRHNTFWVSAFSTRSLVSTRANQMSYTLIT
jgi:hypothetical protein